MTRCREKGEIESVRVKLLVHAHESFAMLSGTSEVCEHRVVSVSVKEAVNKWCVCAFALVLLFTVRFLLLPGFS